MSYSRAVFFNKRIVISDDEKNGGQEPVSTAVLTGDRALLLGLERRMLEIRFFEDEVMRLFMANLVRGSTHLYQGQEAVAVGACSALRDGDTMTCTYRGHGAVLAMGAPLDRTMAEILGKAEGLCGGKGGSMHLTDFSIGALGSFAIVGAHLPFATGAALSAQQLGTGAVSIAFFGDGTTNIGAFHEALNLASVWKLPVIFVCENNLYGEYSPLASTTPVEALTYRQKGHSRTDAGAYRPPGELEEWLARDPIARFERLLTEAGVATSAEIAELRERAEAVVREATERAVAWSEPDVESRFEDVFV